MGVIDVNRLALLRELERRGSIAAVARISGVSSSAVSQQLRKLEAEVGTRLLEQRGRGVGLTVAAQRLAGHAEAVLTILERAESELTSGRDRVHGTVRLTGFASFALRYLPALVARLEAAHPDLEVTFSQVEPAAALEAVAGRRADLAIVDEFPQQPRPLDAGVQRTHLLRDAMIPCLPVGCDAGGSRGVGAPGAVGGSPGTAGAGGTGDPAYPVVLGRLRWVFEPEGTEAHAWAHRVCREAGFEPRVAYTTPDLRVHRELVRTGVAAAFLPRMLLEAGQEDFGYPTTVLDAAGQVPLWRDVFAVTRRSAATSRTVAAVAEGLQAIIAAV